MGGLLREALLREEILLISLPPPTQPTSHLLSCIPQLSPSLFFSWLLSFIFFFPSDDPGLPHANGRHCCGFNANQYSANIHLRRWLHGKRGTWPTCNARGSMFCSRALSWKCTFIHAVQHPSLKVPQKINRQRNREWDCKNRRDNNWGDQKVEGVGRF